ncbi:MAG: hypothetical protein KTR26_18835 [Flammeovirgaceae bacterium]|nr:hypothetical protein [Flammeovirgaceae bacterium]
MEKSQNYIYHQNEFCFTAKGPYKDHVHIVFGNVALYLSIDSFILFSQELSETSNSLERKYCKVNKDFVVKTSFKNMAFVFSTSELEQIKEVINQTFLMIEVQNLIYKE